MEERLMKSRILSKVCFSFFRTKGEGYFFFFFFFFFETKEAMGISWGGKGVLF